MDEVRFPPPLPLARPGLLACHECDLLHGQPELAAGDAMRCRRCGALLARGHSLPLSGQLALSLAALLVFLIASASPIVTLELNGVRAVATLYEAIVDTWAAGQRSVALMALATAFMFPLAVIGLRLWVLAPLVAERPVPGFVPAMRALRWVLRWSMVEVFLLGVLIAVVRSAGVTQVVLGPGLVGYAALVLLLTSIQACGLNELWRLGSRRAR